MGKIGEIRANHLQEGKILTSEENAECYIDLFDMLLVVNTPHEENACVIKPVFPMVYSDRAVTSAFTYTPATADKMGLGDFRYELAKALLWGSQIGWVDPRPLMSERAAKEARLSASSPRRAIIRSSGFPDSATMLRCWPPSG